MSVGVLATGTAVLDWRSTNGGVAATRSQSLVSLVDLS